MEDTNQSIAQECSELARAIAPLVLDELLLSGHQGEDTQHGKSLVGAVYRAVTDLECQGPLSARIARQLLEALERYELALGQLLIAGEEAEPAVIYRVDWCKWENGGGADMQEWKPSDWQSTDEYEAKDKVSSLDLQFAPHFRHRYIRIEIVRC